MNGLFERFLQRSKKAVWTHAGDFPSSTVQPTPFLYDEYDKTTQQLIQGYVRRHMPHGHGNTSQQIFLIIVDMVLKCYTAANQSLVYCTRYEAENAHAKGIFSYDMRNTHHSRTLWRDTHYTPRWMVSVYDSKRKQIIFGGGCNVNDDHAAYKLLAFYSMRSKCLRMVPVSFALGSNAKMVIVGDRNLHIIGGESNSKHIVFDLDTHAYRFIYDFGEMAPRIQEQGLLYIAATNSLLMFGGYHIASYLYYDAFYEFDVGNPLATLSMDICVRCLVDGYMKTHFLNANAAHAMYDRALNQCIQHFIGMDTNVAKHWQKNEQFTMLKGIRSFGTVLYQQRFVIVLGGIADHKLVDEIHWLDLQTDQGWQLSPVALPRRGMCNALLIDDKIHIFPYYAFTDHYHVDVKHIMTA